MISYLDKTFCPYLKCTETKCDRRLTREIELKAKAADLPICQFADKPKCYKAIKGTCYKCSEEYELREYEIKRMGDEKYIYDPTDFECPECDMLEFMSECGECGDCRECK